MKKIVLIIIVVLLSWLFVRFVIGGPEDDWICVNNEWVKHGNPSAPKPTTLCGETIKVKVYFNNSKMDPEYSCNKVFPVEREVIKTQAIAGAALEELLKGYITNEENLEGFTTSINPGVKIQKLTIENNVAKVDFDEQLEYQVGGSCRVAAIRAQITQTLKQFPSVKNVIISIDGRTEDILQP